MEDDDTLYFVTMHVVNGFCVDQQIIGPVYKRDAIRYKDYPGYRLFKVEEINTEYE